MNMTWKWARIPQESKHQHYHILNLQIGLTIYKRFKQSKSSNRAHLKHHMNLSLNRTHTHTHSEFQFPFLHSFSHSLNPASTFHSLTLFSSQVHQSIYVSRCSLPRQHLIYSKVYQSVQVPDCSLPRQYLIHSMIHQFMTIPYLCSTFFSSYQNKKCSVTSHTVFNIRIMHQKRFPLVQVYADKQHSESCTRSV